MCVDPMIHSTIVWYKEEKTEQLRLQLKSLEILIVYARLFSDVLWLVITMFMTSKLMTGLSLTILYIFTSELFPTYTRNSMQALCSALGRAGGIIATQMPLLVSDFNNKEIFFIYT